MPKLKRLKKVDKQSVEDINKLLRQLSHHAEILSSKYLKAILKDSNVELWVAHDVGHIVGMGVLVLVRVPEKLKGRIEDVVVDAEYRGRGIGEALTGKLRDRAQSRKVKVLELSSNARREAANKLYGKLFSSVETNVYRHYFTT